jgi:hypothetical protein
MFISIFPDKFPVDFIDLHQPGPTGLIELIYLNALASSASKKYIVQALSRFVAAGGFNHD